MPVPPTATALPRSSPQTPPQLAAFGLTKRINDTRSLKVFQRSAAHKDILSFLHDLSEAASGTKLSDEVPLSPLVAALRAELNHMANWVDDIPPVTQAMRYGNVAYKQWHARMVAYVPQIMRKLRETLAAQAAASTQPAAAAAVAASASSAVPAAQEATEAKDATLPTSFISSALPTKVEFEASLQLPVEERWRRERAAASSAAAATSAASDIASATLSSPAGAAGAPKAHSLSPAALGELAGYLSESFGNPTRIDYGTGHELSFVVFLRCLDRLGLLAPSDRKAVVLALITTYLSLMRRVQNEYKLEPAGSHGVWGLDDYQFVPFLLGAAQLVGHPEVSPQSIHDEMVLANFSDDYLYLGAISFIRKMKRGHFGEHSPMLNDISALGSWRTVASGLARMYEGEVLGKMPVVQHLPFGTLLVWEEV